MSDLLGFTSITLVSLIIIFITIRWPHLSNILFVALILRVSIILYGHYISPLPDSTADAKTFENTAWALAQYGFFHVWDNFTGPHPYFITWLIAIPYSLFGRSILMAQSISLFFGMGSIILGWLLANKLWNKNTANKVGWAIALFPSLILYSVLILREVYIVFFLLVALYGTVSWVKTDSFKSIILAIIGFIGVTFFHGALFVGCIVFLVTIGLSSLKRLLKLLRTFRINFKILIFLSLFLVSTVFYMSNKISVPYLGTFESATNIERLIDKTRIATRGDASWPEWTKINSPNEIYYKAPLRSIYVVFAPFPWDIKKIKHLIGMFDAFIFIYLSFLIFQNRKHIWRDPALKIILIILLSYILVFGIGVGNFGTGIRHRSKFAVMFILLAAPFLKRYTLFKNIKNL